MKGARIIYSDAEMAWLEANRSLVISDYHRAFCAEFAREDVSAANLHGLRKRKGWKVGRSPGRYKGRGSKYTAAERAWLKANCTLPIADYHRQFQGEFARPEIRAGQLHALRKREGWKTGRTGHFAKGQAPANEQHAHGDEAAWWADLGVDPYPLCRALYAASPDIEAMTAIIVGLSRPTLKEEVCRG